MNNIDSLVKVALEEDIGTGDVSADLLKDKKVSGNIITKESAIVCGIAYAQRTFLQVDDAIKIDWQVKDGDTVVKNQVLCVINGMAKSILKSERVALNFLQTLSAVATQTRYLVDTVSNTNVKLLDTRKTLPGLRSAQKQAVVCGGGINHRMGLYDCVMLKENHIAATGSITKAVALANAKHPNLPLIVEIETLTQLNEILRLSGVDRILCDNFSIENLITAVKITHGKIPLEASGNIDEKTIMAVAETGVDYISTGSITKNIQAIDLSLKFLKDASENPSAI